MNFLNTGLIFRQHVFILCKQYEAEGRGPMAIFAKYSIFCLQYVCKGSEYASASLENTNQAKREVAHTKITTKTSAIKVVFSQGAVKI